MVWNAVPTHRPAQISQELVSSFLIRLFFSIQYYIVLLPIEDRVEEKKPRNKLLMTSQHKREITCCRLGPRQNHHRSSQPHKLDFQLQRYKATPRVRIGLSMVRRERNFQSMVINIHVYDSKIVSKVQIKMDLVTKAACKCISKTLIHLALFSLLKLFTNNGPPRIC